MPNIILIIAIGFIAGLIASLFMENKGLGLIGNIAISIIGSVVGGLFFGAMGIYQSSLVALGTVSVSGSFFFLFIVSFIKRGGMARRI